MEIGFWSFYEEKWGFNYSIAKKPENKLPQYIEFFFQDNRHSSFIKYKFKYSRISHFINFKGCFLHIQKFRFKIFADREQLFNYKKKYK